MPKTHRQRIVLTCALAGLSLGAAQARPIPLRWEKIHVYHLAPTAVFARLGLTHSTKNGYTRDGKQGVPDPNFPPGLTDVVPYDADRLLLVRGTAGGLSVFRTRVAAADTDAPALHLHAELTRRQEDGQAAFGTAEQDEKGDGLPTQISLGAGEAARVYQITTRFNADGTLWVACRISLPLPLPPVVDEALVFVPDRVWTDPLSRKIRPGETAVFEDLASFRRAASRRLGTKGTDTDDDYTLRVTLSPVAATAAHPPL